MKRPLAAAAVLGAVIALSAPAVALADETPLDPAIEYALAAEPGGVVIDQYTAEWPELGMRLEVGPDVSEAGGNVAARSAAARAVGTCATGRICAYSGAAQSGVQLSWSTCGSKSTAALGTVGSIANARSSGTLTARQGSTVRASAGANTYANVPVTYRSSITSVYC